MSNWLNRENEVLRSQESYSKNDSGMKEMEETHIVNDTLVDDMIAEVEWFNSVNIKGVM